MKYMKWLPYYEPGQTEAPLEIYDVIRSGGGTVEGLYTTPEQFIICLISDDVDISILDTKWQVSEITQKAVLNNLKNKDLLVFFNPDGTPVFPSEILKNEYPTVPVDYI